MSLNVMNTYLKFNRRRLIGYSKIILEKHYNKNIFEGLLDTYINVRYIELPSGISVKLINKELVKKAEELSLKHDVEDIKLILTYFPYIYYLDGFLNKDIEITINKINDYRKKYLKLEKLDNELRNNLINDRKRITKYLDSFDSKDFYLNLNKTNIKNLFKTEVLHEIKIPKLYSEYAINNVYNRGIVLENKLFINYYMVSKLILIDVLNKDYKYYIVDFSKTLILKEDKVKRLFNIIDNDLIKDRIILKVSENDFYEYRDSYLKYINEGYKFILYLNKESELNNDAIRRVFSYIEDDTLIKEVK
ncbi:hypothetical protein EGR52_06700 [bacterium]|nr:hypothetical protein [bacterium]